MTAAIGGEAERNSPAHRWKRRRMTAHSTGPPNRSGQDLSYCRVHTLYIHSGLQHFTTPYKIIQNYTTLYTYCKLYTVKLLFYVNVRTTSSTLLSNDTGSLLLRCSRLTCLGNFRCDPRAPSPLRDLMRIHRRILSFSTARFLMTALTTVSTVRRRVSPLLDSTATQGISSAPLPRQALIVLNQEIRSRRLLQTLWKQSCYTICADGGANRIHALGASWEEEVGLPHLIRGDLDSIQTDVRKYYRDKGVTIEQDPDQDTNDLTKCLSACKNYDRIIVYGALGGRLDQEMASLQTLYKHTDWNIWMYSHDTCALALAENVTHEIQLVYSGCDTMPQDEPLLGEGPTCGLIPLGEPCQSVTTTGFRWNLSQQSSSFGGLLSTSNHMEQERVTVVCSQPLIFTAEVHVSDKDPTHGSLTIGTRGAGRISERNR